MAVGRWLEVLVWHRKASASRWPVLQQEGASTRAGGAYVGQPYVLGSWVFGFGG
jgi:hypothetical protein